MAEHVGTILTLFISKSGTKGRIKQGKLQVDKKGILEDKYYNKDINRSILLTSVQSYELATNRGITLPFGSLGENLLIDYNPYHLPSGGKLRIGNDVILEISQYCTMCDHLSTIDEQLPTLLKNDRGIFVKVVKGGTIHREDKIYLLD